MINYPTKPKKLFTSQQISEQIQDGEYSAELMLMHLCNRVDELISKFPIIIETMHEAMSYGPSEADEEIEKAIKTIQDF